ncbi:hypothetical protein HYH03_008672 [Edaphochlamys debaryana]|uniref:Uncharacterized protein n=1 Tax=Edaphochlamys debaryana TaxID=47281 RepID=A0A835XZ96_9CHLO|nr:hypothetical protein HYH03_008672 [Edaphochlamys debaryana]|eukprot:KAG2493008.1 hypothetical protein HYH03_008672 [Edaphochlamys debaryana]
MRSLGRALGGSRLPASRPRQGALKPSGPSRPRRPACQAASTLSAQQGDADAASTSTAAPPSSAVRDQPAASTSGSAGDGPASDAPGPAPRRLLASAALSRRLAAATNILEVSDALAEEGMTSPSEAEALEVVQFYLQRSKPALAMGVYKEMCAARRGGAASVAARRSMDAALTWPPASLPTTTDVVLGLCQQLCIVEAMQVLTDLKVQGLPIGSEEVSFGKVITSPLVQDRPLTVVQPQEGAKTVADGYSRYEFDVFSGSCVSCKSTALVPQGNILLALGRALGVLRKPPVAAIHEFVLQAPDGTSRTFRVGTESAAVPAQMGERVTVVSAPAKNVRKGGLFNASPPGTKPGEAMSSTNHKTGAVLSLLRPPVSAEAAGIPGWVLPVAVVLAGGDAASSLIDPSLPLLIAASAGTFATGTLLGRTVIVPKLKMLPEPAVSLEYTRQQLLSQYNQLCSKSGAVMSESSEDVRLLARLWQLQNKMEAVGAPPSAGVGSAGSSGAAYEARIGRVTRARANIEQRLARRIELLDGYSRVMNMIEIEVEMDIEVPAAEVAGIQQQMVRLVELESLQEDWRAQAEARDEVERLLRSV